MYEMNAKSKKAMHFIKSIKQYKELALTTRDASKCLGRRAVVVGSANQVDLQSPPADFCCDCSRA